MVLFKTDGRLALVPTGPSPGSTRDAVLEQARALVLHSLSRNSRRVYDQALTEFIGWCAAHHRPFTKQTVNDFRAYLESRGLAPSTINVRLSAVRKLALEAADNGHLDQEVAGAIHRAKGTPSAGTRMGNWITRDQAEQLLACPDLATIKGQRDAALLAVLIGCALRREETVRLRVDQVQQRDGRWAIVDMRGKGNRVRTVPMPSWCKTAIEKWQTEAHITEGPLFRAVNKGGRVGPGPMSDHAVFKIVGGYGKACGLSIAPHDLRRTHAKLARRGGSSLEQIQFTLGHATVMTTERYVGMRQDLQDAPCDHLGIRARRQP